jgi:hypothetical protein
MIEESYLLPVSEVERLMRHSGNPSQQNRLLLCTIMEPIEVIDSAKKRRIRLTREDFLQGWSVMMQQLPLTIVPLDGECLARSLFERTDEQMVVGLWSGVEATGLTADGLIGRIVRRLILRPCEANWWEPWLFDEMENWYADDTTDR